MPLRELQRQFLAASYGGDASALRAMVVGDASSAAARIEVYRNNTRTNLVNALRLDYPVVERLVGSEFFSYAARAYSATTPSVSGDINAYGNAFPEFLAAFPDAAGLPYLGDVARIELMHSQSLCSADAEPCAMAELAQLAADDFESLRFDVHPSLRLLQSPYPVLRIWQANQPGAEEVQIDINAGGNCVAALRAGERVRLFALDTAEYAWLSALAAGMRLRDAVESALAVAAEFPLEIYLRRYFEMGVFVNYSCRELPRRYL